MSSATICSGVAGRQSAARLPHAGTPTKGERAVALHAPSKFGLIALAFKPLAFSLLFSFTLKDRVFRYRQNLTESQI